MKGIKALFVVTIVGFVVGLCLLGVKVEYTTVLYWCLVSAWALYAIMLKCTSIEAGTAAERIKGNKNKQGILAERATRHNCQTMVYFLTSHSRLKAKKQLGKFYSVINSGFIKEV